MGRPIIKDLAYQRNLDILEQRAKEILAKEEDEKIDKGLRNPGGREEYQKWYYKNVQAPKDKANPERARARGREYRARNQEKESLRKKAYRLKQKELKNDQ